MAKHPDIVTPNCRKKMPAELTTLYVRGIPAHLKTSFKAWCARRGYSIKEQIILIMKEVERGNFPERFR